MRERKERKKKERRKEEGGVGGEEKEQEGGETSRKLRLFLFYDLAKEIRCHPASV